MHQPQNPQADLLIVYSNIPAPLVNTLRRCFQDAMHALMASLPHDTVLPKPPPPGAQVVNPVAAAVQAIQQHVTRILLKGADDNRGDNVAEENGKRGVLQGKEQCDQPAQGSHVAVTPGAHVTWDDDTSSSSSPSEHPPTWYTGTSGPILGESPPRHTVLDDLPAWGALGMGAHGMLCEVDAGGRRDSATSFAKTEALLQDAAERIEDIQDLYATVCGLGNRSWVS